jgi:membrane associated rhomboid family serine protease/Tfp pilus assembly protein PilF
MAAAVTAMSMTGQPFERLGMSANAFQGEPWRLFTSALPHGDLLHIAFNAYWLWVFGTLVEETYGHLKTLAMVALFAAGSAAAEYAVFVGGIGLSGVVYGLAGLLYVLSRSDRQLKGALDARTVQLFVVWFFICIGTTVLGIWPVANVAHGSGALLGALLGGVLARPARPFDGNLWSVKRVGLAAGLVVVLAVMLAGASVLRPFVNVSRRSGQESIELGYAALQDGKHAEAIDHYKQAVMLQPTDASNWYHLGAAFHGLGDRAGAADAFAKAASLKPDEPMYRMAVAGSKRELGTDAQKAGRTEEAIRLYEQSVAAADDASTYFALGLAYRAAGRVADSARALARARELDSKFSLPAESGTE